jgi:integrase
LIFEGQRHQKSTKARNRVKAEGIASAFRTALAERRVGIIERKPAPSLSEAMKNFLNWSKHEHSEHPATHKRYVTSSHALLAYLKFKTKPIDQITGQDIEDFKQWRVNQKGKTTKRRIKPATVNRELACLKAMFFYALKSTQFRHPMSKKLVGNEAPRLFDEASKDQDPFYVISFEEQHRYLSATRGNLKDIAGIMLETGMRPEEVYRIQVKNVCLDEGYLYNPFGKTKAARRKVPLNAAALAIIQRRVEAAKGTCIFPHKKDVNKPMLKVNNTHDRLLKKLKLKFRLYDFRHTWATRAMQSKEVDLVTLAALMGHSKLTMVLRYARPQEEHQADVVKRLEKVNAAKQIAEFERKKIEPERVPTISPTVAENPANFSEVENEGKSQRFN